ncbi:acetylornithine deacetylase or succinyl-diaminopimelate desuccinylase [Solidesulfovibrio fructosivorans JJ]]|uniref:Acetylornithine deacetylase or succinyl-diaminopimelate desuccinylase n=1 Tax=Solidesulfovibrio fructosivorans JJ] TaxID=596151 RepID=E1JWF9_SOLFR|nr:M20 family metallo-hydrolase [Solidesulfovibrio fructosivorans]EFL51256.1 acetylornithine deacetylase or succinyl-diaminopimelate desuccinylase [Solidesulfovibrio fructosivorans JJ]]
MLDALLARLDAMRDTVIDLQRELTAIPALGPDNGGPGEREKADRLKALLAAMGFPEAREINAPDSRVPCGHRPNLAVVIPGRDTSRTLWVISHIDIVPPGDRTLWKTDPYTLAVDGDAIFGRGVEDNQQAIASSVALGKAILDAGETPPINYGLLFVADEETGSKYGLDYVAEHHDGLFTPDDLFLVPDFGQADSEMVEVAEKSMLWLKIIVNGRQCHASTPEAGVNSLAAAALFILKIPKLHDRFPAKNPLFQPANSTFEPTKKEANVENINTIPGRDVFYVDCRVLPEYPLDDVLAVIREYGAEVEAACGVTVDYEVVQREQAAPTTPEDAPIVRKVMSAVRAVYGANPRPMGIGGGTVAAYLRRRGYPTVVWATLVHNAHQPNERSSIRATLGDAKVMARVLFE